jgi:hypothetical protein
MVEALPAGDNAHRLPPDLLAGFIKRSKAICFVPAWIRFSNGSTLSFCPPIRLTGNFSTVSLANCCKEHWSSGFADPTDRWAALPEAYLRRE